MKNPKKWVKALDEILDQLEKLEPKDRLGYVSGIAICNVALAYSVNGWNTWLMDPRVTDRISEEDLKEIFVKFKKDTQSFLGTDKKFTVKYGGEEKPSKMSQLVV